MPLRVLLLPQQDLEFMDHSEDRDMKDTEENVVDRIRVGTESERNLVREELDLPRTLGLVFTLKVK